MTLVEHQAIKPEMTGSIPVDPIHLSPSSPHVQVMPVNTAQDQVMPYGVFGINRKTLYSLYWN